jgi:DNA repair exonuclease SbcCD ATPase subunit
MENTNIVTIGVDKYDALVKQVASIQDSSQSLRKSNAVLKAENDRLRTEVTNTERVLVITKEPYTSSTKKEYKNLDSVREEVKKDFKKDLEKLETQLKEKENAVKEAEALYNREATDYRIKRDNIQAEFDRTEKDLVEKHKATIDKINKDKEKQIKDLTEELNKERENKTDREVAEARKKEIETLKKKIARLETDVKRLVKMSWLGRVWYKFATKTVTYEAAKEVAAENDVVVQSTPGSYRRVSCLSF